MNPPGSQVCSMGWINEAQDSLLMTGSNDGVVRIRGGLLQAGSEGPGSMEPPRLITALHAAPVREILLMEL